MIQKLRKIIEENNSIILLSHFNPDGDAYGSQIGLRESLRLTYPEKDVYAIGSGLKDFYSLIGEMDEVSDEIIEQSLIILLDANELYRFEDQRFLKGKDFVLIDHHIQNATFDFETVIVDTEASSTCELVALIIKELNFKIDSKAANALFLGLLTDSGRFQWVSNFSKVFAIASFLCDNGANPKTIFSKLNVVKQKDYELRRNVFSKIKKNGKVIYRCFTNKELKELGVTSSHALSTVNQIGNIENYPIWMMYAYEEDGSAHFEFRSSKYIVQPLAKSYGGGGHANAAGVTIKNCNETIVNEIIVKLNKLTEEK